MDLKKINITYLGMSLFIILLSLLIYSQALSWQNLVDKQCTDIGLENKDGGNCCFINYENGTVIPKYRAVPCDNLTFIPPSEKFNYDPYEGFPTLFFNESQWAD